MFRFIHFLALCIMLLVTLTACVSSNTPSFSVLTEGEPPRLGKMVFAGLQAQVFGNLNSKEVLVLTDGDRGHNNSMLFLAKNTFSEMCSDKLIVVLARAGCYLKKGGKKSTGPIHIEGRGDHYTRTAINMFTNALREIRTYFDAERMTVMGRSGGAATIAVILGQQPDLIDAAVLVSLPANLKKWSSYRQRITNEGGPKGWRGSLSPHNFVKNIRPDIPVVVVVGSRDKNTPVWLSQGYVDAAHEAGLLNVRMVTINGFGHSGGFTIDEPAHPLSIRSVQWALTALTGEQRSGSTLLDH